MWRLIAAAVSGLLALVIFGLVISAISTVGINERLESEPIEISDGAQAVVLDQAIVPYTQTSATLRVSSETPVFVGAASGVDTASYLTDVPHEQITRLDFESPIDHRKVPGEGTLPAAPASLDWWEKKQSGTDVTYTFDLDAAPQTIVIAPLKEGEDLDISIDASMQAPGIFGLSLGGASLGLILLGLALFLGLGWWFSRLRPPPRRRMDKKLESEQKKLTEARRAEIERAEGSSPAGSRGAAANAKAEKLEQADAEREARAEAANKQAANKQAAEKQAADKRASDKDAADTQAAEGKAAGKRDAEGKSAESATATDDAQAPTTAGSSTAGSAAGPAAPDARPSTGPIPERPSVAPAAPGPAGEVVYETRRSRKNSHAL